MVAINVSRALIRAITRDGWNAIPEAAREGVGDPDPPSAAYRERLAQAFQAHERPQRQDVAAGEAECAFEQIVDAQLLWDRAMAEAVAVAAAADRFSGPVVAMVGAEHTRLGQGIAGQLAAMGRPKPFVLLTAAATRS